MKCEERYRRKNQYEEGMWNVNTVLMGGLGGEPDSSDSSSEEGNHRHVLYTYTYVYISTYMYRVSCIKPVSPL